MKIEYQKITNLLDRYKPSKQIRFKTSMLRLDLCDFSEAYIVVKGTITLTKTDGRSFIDIRNKKTMHHLSNAYQILIMY